MQLPGRRPGAYGGNTSVPVVVRRADPPSTGTGRGRWSSPLAKTADSHARAPLPQRQRRAGSVVGQLQVSALRARSFAAWRTPISRPARPHGRNLTTAPAPARLLLGWLCTAGVRAGRRRRRRAGASGAAHPPKLQPTTTTASSECWCQCVNVSNGAAGPPPSSSQAGSLLQFSASSQPSGHPSETTPTWSTTHFACHQLHANNSPTPQPCCCSPFVAGPEPSPRARPRASGRRRRGRPLRQEGRAGEQHEDRGPAPRRG